MNVWDELPKPFFVLAPMDDVTDTVFRQAVADLAAPDLFFTEFVNVDGLQSPGRPKLLKRIQFMAKEKPIIAQIWGLQPENFYKTAKQLADGTLMDEANWYARRSGLSEVQGSKEKRANRTDSTESESRTQQTPQFAKSSHLVAGSASERVAAARTSGMGFDGIDLNFGCPEKSVVKNGACVALINNRELAVEINTGGYFGFVFVIESRPLVNFFTTAGNLPVLRRVHWGKEHRLRYSDVRPGSAELGRSSDR